MSSSDSQESIDKDYNVEKIVDRRFCYLTRKYWYKIRWEGYTKEDDTWEPIENLVRFIKQIIFEIFNFFSFLKIC